MTQPMRRCELRRPFRMAIGTHAFAPRLVGSWTNFLGFRSLSLSPPQAIECRCFATMAMAMRHWKLPEVDWDQCPDPLFGWDKWPHPTLRYTRYLSPCRLHKQVANASTGQDCITVEPGLKAVRPTVDRLRLLLLRYRPTAGLLLPWIVLIAPALICSRAVLPPLPCPEKSAIALILWCPALPWHEARWQLAIVNSSAELIHSLLNHLAKFIQNSIARFRCQSVLILLQAPFYVVDVRSNNLIDFVWQDSTRIC